MKWMCMCMLSGHVQWWEKYSILMDLMVLTATGRTWRRNHASFASAALEAVPAWCWVCSRHWEHCIWPRTAHMDSAECVQMLENHFLSYLRHFYRIPLVYQQDNAANHRSNTTKAWFNQRHIKLLECPAWSPCNPMENVWAIPVWHVYANNKHYNSVEELKIAILAAWQNLEPNVLQKLADSMKNCIYDLIMNEGGPISY
jgi:hypothetical protein